MKGKNGELRVGYLEDFYVYEYKGVGSSREDRESKVGKELGFWKLKGGMISGVSC